MVRKVSGVWIEACIDLGREHTFPGKMCQILSIIDALGGGVRVVSVCRRCCRISTNRKLRMVGASREG